jgi:hypothetical protein
VIPSSRPDSFLPLRSYAVDTLPVFHELGHVLGSRQPLPKTLDLLRPIPETSAAREDRSVRESGRRSKGLQGSAAAGTVPEAHATEMHRSRICHRF